MKRCVGQHSVQPEPELPFAVVSHHPPQPVNGTFPTSDPYTYARIASTLYHSSKSTRGEIDLLADMIKEESKSCIFTHFGEVQELTTPETI